MINGIVTSITSYSKELADRGHEVLIVVPDNPWLSEFSYPGIEILSVKWFPAFFYPDFKITFAFTPTLVKRIRTFKPDIIHFHTQFILGWQAIVLGKILSIPRIGTFHTYIADEGYLKIIGMENFKIFGEIGWKYNNFFYEHCEHVIAPSINAKTELSEHGIPEEKIDILPNPAPVQSSWVHISTSFLPIFVPNAILYIGRISKEKSLTVCLDAIYVISREIPNVHFVIVGSGPDEEEIKQYAKDLGIEQNIIFLGAIEHETLMQSDIFQKSKLFLTASTTETQGITLLEAMSEWLPTVGVEAKGVGEIIEDNGYKARPGNYGELALYCIRILKDDILRQKLGERSREIVKKYDIKKLTNDLENIYQQTIQNGLRKK